MFLATASLCTHPGLTLPHLLPTHAHPIMLLHTKAGTQEIFLQLGSHKPHCWKQSWWALWRRRICLELTAVCSWGLEGQPGSVGYIPMCDLVYQCSYRLSQLLPPPKDSSGSTPIGPQHCGPQQRVPKERHPPQPAFPFFLPAVMIWGGHL